VNVLDLCSGVGGIALGIKLAVPTARTVCYVEREAFCCEVLAHQMQASRLDAAPIWTDLGTFDGRPWRGVVDCVSAGFPCQRFSTASRGRTVAEDLWPHIIRVIEESRPSTVFLENVQRWPIGRASRCLSDLGYATAFDPFDSAEVGAAHRRRRWFLVAHLDRQGQLLSPVDDQVASLRPPGTSHRHRDPARVLGVAVRPATRMDRLRAIGNGVDVLAVAHAFRTLSDRLQVTP